MKNLKIIRFIIGIAINVVFIIFLAKALIFVTQHGGFSNVPRPEEVIVEIIVMLALLLFFLIPMFFPKTWLGVIIVILGIAGLYLFKNKINIGLLILAGFAAYGIVVVQSAKIAKKNSKK